MAPGDKFVIGILGLTNREVPVRLVPDDSAPVVHHTLNSQMIVVNECEDHHWLRVLGRRGEDGFVHANDVMELGYSVRRNTPPSVILM